MRTFTIFITLLITLSLSANDNDISDKEFALQIIKEKAPNILKQEQAFIHQEMVSDPQLTLENFYDPVSAEEFYQVYESLALNKEDEMLKNWN